MNKLTSLKLTSLLALSGLLSPVVNADVTSTLVEKKPKQAETNSTSVGTESKNRTVKLTLTSALPFVLPEGFVLAPLEGYSTIVLPTEDKKRWAAFAQAGEIRTYNSLGRELGDSSIEKFAFGTRILKEASPDVVYTIYDRVNDATVEVYGGVGYRTIGANPVGISNYLAYAFVVPSDGDYDCYIAYVGDGCPGFVDVFDESDEKQSSVLEDFTDNASDTSPDEPVPVSFSDGFTHHLRLSLKKGFNRITIGTPYIWHYTPDIWGVVLVKNS